MIGFQHEEIPIDPNKKLGSEDKRVSDTTQYQKLQGMLVIHIELTT